MLNALLKKMGLLLLVFGPSLCVAQTAYLSPEEISEGDTTNLVIEIEDATPSLHDLDTSALENNFEILGTSSSVQMVQVQNKVTNLTRWEIELFPLKTGQLEIPPLSINGNMTQKLVLNVKKPDPGNGSGGGKDVFIQVSAEPENPYVGQQTNIVVKLFHKIRIVNGTLSEPEAVNADVYRIGNDISYAQTVDGTRYNVLERTFALFTNTPGETIIAPVSFRGQIESESDDFSSSLGTFMRQVKQIKRSANELILNVKDIPANFTGKFWLPANDVRLSQSWTEQAAELKVGDSLNRTIKLIADGLPAEALPNDLYSDTSGLLNIYPDKASRSNQDIGKKLVGKVEQRFAMILSKPGYITIPELRLKWWDLDEQVEKLAVLPEKVLIVTGDAAADTSSSADDQSPQALQIQGQAPVRLVPGGENYWPWVAGILFLLWLTTLFLWYKSRVLPPQAEPPQPQAKNFNRALLKQACQSNNPVAARNELIAWAKGHWPEVTITGLHQVKAHANSRELIGELNRLDEILFSQGQNNWSGEALWDAFIIEQQISAPARPAVVQEVIPPLYFPLDKTRTYLKMPGLVHTSLNTRLKCSFTSVNCASSLTCAGPLISKHNAGLFASSELRPKSY